MTNSKTGRTINDVVRDLISEVDDGTLALLVSEQASQPVHDEVVSYKPLCFVRLPLLPYFRGSILTS